MIQIMEAPGIEPGSRSLPLFDPTCVAADLDLGLSGSQRQDPSRPVPGLLSSPRSRATLATSEHYDGPTPTHSPRSGGPRVQLCLGSERELNVVVGFCVFASGFTRHRHPRHASGVSLPLSKPCRPRLGPALPRFNGIPTLTPAGGGSIPASPAPVESGESPAGPPG